MARFMSNDRAKITIQDVARAAGVAPSTVSRVLNKVTNDYISEATRARVCEAAKGMGYTPNNAARALASGKSRLVGLWTTALSDFYIEIMRHLDERARRDGFGLMASDIAWGSTPDDVTRAAQWPVDGVVVIDPYPGMPLPENRTAARSLPVVAMGGLYWAEADYVAVDLAAGAKDAVRHLLAGGARRVAFVTPPVPGVDARRESYTAEMRAAGRKPECLVTAKLSRQAGRQALLDFAKKHALPDAIFCFNDVIAIGVQRALHDLGARIPEDVALVGCDGIEDTEYTDPPLSTIVHPLNAMCAKAWRFLRNRMADPDIALQQVTMKPRLVVRGTSRAGGGK